MTGLLMGSNMCLKGDNKNKRYHKNLTRKASITTAADDIHEYFFIVFHRK